MTDLFRKEAVGHATRRLAGDVILMSSVSFRLLAVLVCLIMVIGALFVSTASYARRETVVGWLVPEAGLIRLPARQGGVVAALHVGEGQIVRAGQPIATLTLSSELDSGDSFAAVSRSLASQKAAVIAQTAAAQAALEAERRQMIARREALGRELAESVRRQDLQTQRLDLARAEVTRAETIAAQGYLPRRELDARRSAALAMEQEAVEAATQVLAYQRQIEEVDARLQAIPLDLAVSEAENASAGAGIDQQVTRAATESVYMVVATVSGRVAVLPVRVGQTVTPGAAVAVLAAGASPLEAELYAPSRAAGFIQEGQTVRLMYQAFPHQRFGTGKGVVSSISRTVLAPAEVAIPGLNVKEPVFRIRVRLERGDVAAYGRRVPLQPGMILGADVIIDQRTLFEWLFDPLYAAGRR